MPSDFTLGIQSATGHAGVPNEITTGVDTTTDVAPARAVLDWFQEFTLLDANGTPYTAKITLDRTDTVPIDGAIIRLKFNMPASTDPTVEIRDDIAGGTILQSFSGVADETRIFLFEGIYKGVSSVWTRYDGRYVI